MIFPWMGEWGGVSQDETVPPWIIRHELDSLDDLENKDKCRREITWAGRGGSGL